MTTRVRGGTTYKNWGGWNWSAGHETAPGERLTLEDLAVPALDDLDELFKQHDIAYDAAEDIADPLQRALAIQLADATLEGELSHLDPNSLDEHGKLYREIAQQDFLVKMLTWDLFQIAQASASPLDHDIATYFAAARQWIPTIDPFVLDLNGDGFATTGSLDSVVLFDHNGDAIKNGTGWIRGNDGLLVRDLNHNGTIDTGAELFGNDTAVPGGGFAADGFSAIAQIDTNGDGIINASDTGFNDLLVWQDINQNGISEANELKTLTELGIVSIGVTKTSANINLQNGNRVTGTGTFTRADSTTGTTGSLELAENRFFREVINPPAVDPTVTSLPDMHGSGAVLDLRQAASGSGTLRSELSAYSTLTTRSQQQAALVP